MIRNVAEHANPPKVARPEVNTWTAVQVRRFLAHVEDSRWYPMWLLYFTTGMRRGEVLGLRWDDVDLDAGKVAIRHVLTRVDGKTISTEPKTSKGRRTIALDAASVAALRGWRQRQLEERLAAGPAWQNTDLVFTWPDGSFVGPNLPTKWIRELADDIGLPRIRLHDARHSFATLALESGVDVKIVSERLGHANTAITRDVYQHVTPAMDQAAADTVA
ncbi:MAG: site-specific integrase [Nitriliruptorales bacterium]